MLKKETVETTEETTEATEETTEEATEKKKRRPYKHRKKYRQLKERPSPKLIEAKLCRSCVEEYSSSSSARRHERNLHPDHVFL